jgi:AAA family ATP:ADP antiporter
MTNSDGSKPSPKSSKRLSILDRILNIVAEVKAGEGALALLLLATVFLILCAYYVLKTVREGLILSGVGGDEVKIALTGLMALLMLGIVPAYSHLASRVPRKRLLGVSYSLVIGSLVVFFVLGRAGLSVGLAFFVWLGIVSMFLIAQFWSFANDLYTQEQGKRLFAIIAVGGSAGAIVGPQLVKLSKDPYVSMGIAAAIFVAVLAMLGLADKLARRDTPATDVTPDEPLAKGGGFGLVLRERYLLLIGVMLFLANMVNTTGEYILSNSAIEYANERVPGQTFKDVLEPPASTQPATGTAVAAAEVTPTKECLATGAHVAGKWAPEPDRTKVAELTSRSCTRDRWSEAARKCFDAAGDTAAIDQCAKKQVFGAARGKIINTFYGNFFSLVNLIGFLIQILLASRIIKYAGLRAALFVFPVIALAGYGAIGLIGGLTLLRIAKTAENATDYSLQNTVRQALFLPTSREAKYKAKAAIDTFFVRFGDTAAAVLVLVGVNQLNLGRAQLALVNAGVIMVWLVVAVGIARRHREIEAKGMPTATAVKQ